MKTLKISLVVTMAAMLAWWLGVAHQIWPAHPHLAFFLLALVLYVVLQLVWSDARPEPKKDH